MSEFVNSFHINVPDIEADQYYIDPQPPEDAWQQLDDIETTTEHELSGSAYRYREGGTWYILALETEQSTSSLTVRNGTQLTKENTRLLDNENTRHQEIIERALLDSLSWYLTDQLDYWERARSQEFYQRSPRDTINGYDAYPGYDTQITYTDDFYLTVDPKIKYISSRSVGQYLRDPRLTVDDIRDRLGDRYCTLMSTQRPSVELVSIADNITVSDKSITIEGEKKSVLEYLKDNPDRYPADVVERVDPEEPIAKVRFPWADKSVNSAPSLLHPLPAEMEEQMTRYAVRSAAQRWEDTLSFVRQIQYIQIYGVTCNVANEPRTDGVDKFKYPTLQFGGGVTLTMGETHAGNGEQTILPMNWNESIGDYLREFGAAKQIRGVPEIGVLHPAGYKQTASEAYKDISEYVESHTGLRMAMRAGTVNYEDSEKLQEWLRRYRDDVDGVLILLAERSDYFELRSVLEGLPAQAIMLSNYQDAAHANQFDDTLFNTAMGLATKINIRPVLLAESLAADAYLGFSFAGDDINTAAAALLSGEDGDLMFQTESNLAAGASTVTQKAIVQQIIQKSVTQALDDGLDGIQTLTIHRNGQFGEGELEGIEAGIDNLVASNTLPRSAGWQAVQISSNSRYRIYDTEEHDYVCPTGAYATLDEQNVLVSTFGRPHLHQGSPQPLQCTVVAGSGETDVETVGRDIFALSFLNWGAPTMKMKEPLTTYLPSKMHDILESGARLHYPPV